MRRTLVAVAAVFCLVTTAFTTPARAEPTADEVRAQIAALEAEYAALTDSYAANSVGLEEAQSTLERTGAELAKSEADLASLQSQVNQITLLQWQDQSFNQSLALFASPDADTLMERLASVEQLNSQHAQLVRRYTDERANLDQLRVFEEAAIQAIADRGVAMEQQLADIQRKTTEARNLLATVVSPRDVGENTGLTDHAIVVKQTLAGVFLEITHIGGYRAGDWGDHGAGRALDVMIPNYSSQHGVDLGDTIARWCQDNYRTLGIKYLIWRQRYWQAGWGPDSWQWMADRGSPTQNHYDHVHISLNS